jgi:hypothetical protein
MVLKNILAVTFYGAAAAAIIALPFFFYNWIEYVGLRSRALPGSRALIPLPTLSISFFVIPILIAIAAATAASAIAQQETRSFLNDSAGDTKVWINGEQIAQKDEVLTALRGLSSRASHHSHPTSRIRVEMLNSKGYLVLELGRDSGNPREYWVFNPQMGITSSNEIGRVTTSAFDQYP